MVHLIALHRAAILERWAVSARHFDSARGLDAEALLGSLPRYLALLCHGAGPDGGLTSAQQRVIERHVGDRLQQGFLLNDILTEFGVLASSIAGVLAEVLPGEVLGPSAAARLRRELYLTMLRATDVFNEHMLEDEPLEKRLRRMIGEAASGSPRVRLSSESTLEGRLREMLELSRAAVAADVAALLRFDDAEGRFSVAASAGNGAAALARFVVGLDHRGVPSGGRGSLVFVDETSIAGDEGLRAAGVHSLVAVRVTIRGQLAALLYLGRGAPRTFTPSDLRKLEALGEIVAPQLDIVLLRAEIQDLSSRAAALGPPAGDPHALALAYALSASLAAARAEMTGLVPGELAGAGAVETLGDAFQRMERLIAAWLATRPRRPS